MKEETMNLLEPTTIAEELDLLTIRLVRRQLLANGYIKCYDVAGRTFYISPEANKSSRLYWQGFWLLNEYYIYVEEK